MALSLYTLVMLWRGIRRWGPPSGGLLPNRLQKLPSKYYHYSKEGVSFGFSEVKLQDTGDWGRERVEGHEPKSETLLVIARSQFWMMRY